MLYTFKQFVEKRSHIELNPRLSVYEQLLPYSRLEDYYISFTDIDKLGIKPSQRIYSNTPLGVYFYPLKKTWIDANVNPEDGFKWLSPDFYRRNYIWLVKRNDTNILVASKYSKLDFQEDIVKLMSIYDKNKIETYLQSAMIKDKPYCEKIYKTIYHIISNYTFSMGVDVIRFTKIFKDLGYKGILDDSENSFMQSGEHSQAVFFKTNDYKIIDKIINNIKPEQDDDDDDDDDDFE